jgi:hypothetical protein
MKTVYKKFQSEKARDYHGKQSKRGMREFHKISEGALYKFITLPIFPPAPSTPATPVLA